MPISRKHFVKNIFFLTLGFKNRKAFLRSGEDQGGKESFRRVRPGEPGWPLDREWDNLKKQVNGRLMKLNNPFVNPPADFFKQVKNPYYIGDTPELTQSLGYAGA